MMPTTKPRFSVVLDTEISDALDAYWHDHRYKSKNVAINELLRGAFSIMESTNETNARFTISPAALSVAKKYDRLDSYSQAVVEAVVDLELARVNSFGGQTAIEISSDLPETERDHQGAEAAR